MLVVETDHKEGYIGIDRAKFNEHVNIVMNIETDRLPYDDSTVDEVYCAHVLEHVDRPELLIEEMKRVLKTGGLLHIVAPHYSHPNSHVPVHKNYWGINTKILFDGSYHEFGTWLKVEWDVNFANRTGLKQRLLKPFILKYPSVYEGHLTSFFPLAEVSFKLYK